MIIKRSFPYKRKRNGLRLEPCGKEDFNIRASEKTFSIQTKDFLFDILDSNHLITHARKPKYFIYNYTIYNNNLTHTRLKNESGSSYK